MDQKLIEVERAEDAPRILEEYGVCILKNILNEEECNGIVNGMIGSLEHLTADMTTPFKFKEQDTWKTLEYLYPIKRQQYQHWGLGHAQFVWDVRCNPKIINAFATIWGTNDLLVSYDGIAFHLPPEINRKPFQKGVAYHVDQSFLKEGKECIQGHINGFDTNEGDATLAVLVNSHKYFAEYGQEKNVTNPRDWYEIPDISFYLERGCIEHRITCPKGSLVLWDSRTLHFGSEPLKGRKAPNYRALIYLCYTPRSKLPSEEMRRKKVQYFEELAMTNHWPHNPEPFRKLPRTYGKWLPTKVLRPLPRPVVPRDCYPLLGYNPGEY